MTACFYCPRPGFGPAHFADGTMVLVCGEHKAQHLALVEVQEELNRAERAQRLAFVEYLAEASAFDAAKGRFDRTKRAADEARARLRTAERSR